MGNNSCINFEFKGNNWKWLQTLTIMGLKLVFCFWFKDTDTRSWIESTEKHVSCSRKRKNDFHQVNLQPFNIIGSKRNVASRYNLFNSCGRIGGSILEIFAFYGMNSVQGKQRKHCEHSQFGFSILYFRKYKKFQQTENFCTRFRGKLLIFLGVFVLYGFHPTWLLTFSGSKNV